MIRVSDTVISSQAKKNVIECLESGWISASSPFVKQFEEKFSRTVNVPYGVAVSNGTAALHLACDVLGIGPGDEVIIPNLTIISCALAVIYLGATPVFVDVDPVTGNLNPTQLEEKITNKTKAVMVVHLYGHAADLDPIIEIVRRRKLFLIEDAAEAHGSLYKGQPLGSFGDVATFSFYANKIISTGEGGMVVTPHETLYQQLVLKRDLAHTHGQRFHHTAIGYNYRLGGLQAAIGCGEVESLDTYVQKKRQIAEFYGQHLKNIQWLELPFEQAYAFSTYWMYAVKIKQGFSKNKQEIMKKLFAQGVETRPFFYPLHQQPVLAQYSSAEKFPVSIDLSQRGFYIPSGLGLTRSDQQQVIEALKNI